MPSFQDSAVLFLLALLLFGPKKLPELARYVGKMMNEFRRASNEFRMQMEDEFRQSEQAEQQKKIAAMEAAAPIAPIIAPVDTPPGAELDAALQTPHVPDEPSMLPVEPVATTMASEPLPIATSGDLELMPPATGLPVARSSSPAAGMFDSIPQTMSPSAHAAVEHVEAQSEVTHG